MAKFEINYGRDFGGGVGDRWLWKTVEAENEEEAIKELFNEHKASYIVSVMQIEV